MAKRKRKEIEKFEFGQQFELLGEIEEGDLDNSTWSIDEIDPDGQRLVIVTGRELRELYEYLHEIFGSKTPDIRGSTPTAVQNNDIPRHANGEPIDMVVMSSPFRATMDLDALREMGPGLR